MTKTPLRTLKYNITKVKQQGTVEDRPRKGRPRKITASQSIALGQSIRRNKEINIERTGPTTVPSLIFECIPMDGSTLTTTNGLQEYFALIMVLQY